MRRRRSIASRKAIDALVRSLGFEVSHERKSDRLDFRDVAVWRAKSALRKAYALGLKAARKKNPLLKNRRRRTRRGKRR